MRSRTRGPRRAPLDPHGRTDRRRARAGRQAPRPAQVSWLQRCSCAARLQRAAPPQRGRPTQVLRTAALLRSRLPPPPPPEQGPARPAARAVAGRQRPARPPRPPGARSGARPARARPARATEPVRALSEQHQLAGWRGMQRRPRCWRTSAALPLQGPPHRTLSGEPGCRGLNAQARPPQCARAGRQGLPRAPRWRTDGERASCTLSMLGMVGLLQFLYQSLHKLYQNSIFL